jgi:hypothetical protein
VDHEPNLRLPDDIDLRDRFIGSRLGVEAAEPFWCRELLGVDAIQSIL